MVSGEEDFTQRSKAFVDHRFIKGVALQDPTIAACLPTSIENTAIAYDLVNDRFKVDIEAISAGAIPADITDKWARQLGKIDLDRVLGAALSHANPVISRLTDGSSFIDPRDRNWTITESVTVEQATAASLKATVTQASIARTISGTVSVVCAIPANLQATVTQVSSARSYTPPTSLVSGNKTVTTAGTPVQLASNILFNSVVIQAMLSNTGKILVGNATRQDVELYAGEAVTVVISNTDKIYIDSTVNGEGIEFLGS